MDKKIDYTLKVGDILKLWFEVTSKIDAYYTAEVLDINWGIKAAAIQIKGFDKPTVVSLGSISRQDLLTK